LIHKFCFQREEEPMPGKDAAASIVDAIDILADDHWRINQIFSRFQQLLDEGYPDVEIRQVLVETACTELAIHDQIEKELFYPVLRVALNECSALEQAEVEHMLVRQLAADLELMEPEDDLYEAKFIVLGQYVRHHIEEEQLVIFPKAITSGYPFGSLGEDIRRRREELRDAFSMPDDEFMQHGNLPDENYRHL
jgi:hemerythrin-like domain-containing protein